MSRIQELNSYLSSFAGISKAGNVGIFILLNFGNKLESVISPIILNSICHYKSKIAQQFIQLIFNCTWRAFEFEGVV